ncbi:MAG: response regulator transcription factor [Verrucomicrobia bacterium]|nr:response regulator transcription factor [Cytophagales bacterium]
MKKILLVEDDANLGFVIKDSLEMNGLQVHLCTDGKSAMTDFETKSFDLCLIDVMLPKQDGISLTQAIRKTNAWIPVLFLTARNSETDKIAGFRAGGDDYITKPFSMDELLLRIEVFLRRTKNPESQEFMLGNFAFSYKNLTLQLAQNTKTLTQKEADILLYFCKNLNQVIKREEILKAVWGDDDYFMGRSLDVFISKLRKYLQDDPNLEIQNIHGVGFRFTV